MGDGERPQTGEPVEHASEDPLELLLERLGDAHLPTDVEDLVLAAVQGDDALAAAVSGTGPHRPTPTGAAGEVPALYLTGITVEGFRGIAGTARLGLRPGPGLTLVVGRNGSGKSSFAEAAELALTGTSQRWAERHAVWKDGWRCLHHDGPRRIEVTLRADGEPTDLVVSRMWAESDDLPGGMATAARRGEAGGPVGELGWGPALRTWRPFLSYNELGGLFEGGPSKLHDAISAVVGLDEWTAAAERLRTTGRVLNKSVKAADDEAKALKALVATMEGDDRVLAARRALARPAAPGLDELRSLAGGTAPDGALHALGGLCELTPIDLDQLADQAERVRAAVAALDALAGTDAARAALHAELLEAALAWHDAHPSSSSCPVCATTTTLDATWAERTRREVDTLRAEATAAATAADHLRAAVRAARGAVAVAPPAVSAWAAHAGSDTVPGVDGLDAAVGELGALWLRWVLAPEDPLALADHLDAVGTELAGAVELVRAAAELEHQRRQDLWQPVAERIAGWLPAAEAAQEQRRVVARAREAQQWLLDTTAEVRNRRLEVIMADVVQRWEAMRHSSNVELLRLALTGQNTSRQLTIDAAVDGATTSGLSVMSQGELNALAIALFLPRATMGASPFRFLLIDDPVQAMDAARVDGLARTLHDVGRTRQVIVFTHDERLPEACRRLALAATVFEVHRGERSQVGVRRRDHPARMYLDDARAVLNTPDFPADARRRVIPGLCRNAVESAAIDLARHRLMGDGRSFDDVEQALRAANGLRRKLALALRGDAQAEVMSAVRSRCGDRAADVLADLTTGAHQAIDRDAEAVVRDTKALVVHLLGAVETT